MKQQVVDFTKMRKGSKPRGRKVDNCPKCGRKGERTNYTNGQTSYIHTMCNAGLFWNVTDSCLIQPAASEEGK